MKLNVLACLFAMLGWSILTPRFTFGQNPYQATDLKNIVLPSPTASALGQYGNVPVGIYTGTAKVSVPLYEIHEGVLTLPISLSYNGGGMKLGEIAPWTGMGWSLNAGGAITRTVHGIPDEGSINAGYTVNTSPTLGQMKSSLLGQIDTDPDVFCFNFNGKSGKFYISKNNFICISPYQNLKIQAFNASGGLVNPPFTNLGATLQFRVTDEDGLVYEFRDYETTRSVTYNPNVVPDPILTGIGIPLASPTAWYLTRMYDPVGDTINFFYNNYTLTYDQGSSIQHFILTNQQGSSLAPVVQQPYTVNVARCQTQNWRLAQISFSNGAINFTAGYPRVDLVGDSMLTKIAITDNSGNLVKGYALHYSYGAGSDATGYSLTSTDDNTYATYVAYQSFASFRRLLLDSVATLNNGGISTGQRYSFLYYNATGSFPSRFSKQTDSWGFYNANGYSDQNFLNYQLVGTDATNPANYQIVGNTPNISAAITGALKQITYPTGGYTMFNYELHDAYLGRGVVPPTASAQYEQMVIDYSAYSMLGYTDTVINGVDCKYENFTVQTGAGATVDIAVSNMIYQSPGIVMKFDIYNSAGTDILPYSTIINGPNSNTTINQTYHSVSSTTTATLADGIYKIIFTPISSFIGSSNYMNTYDGNATFVVNGWSNIVLHPDSVDFVQAIGGLRLNSTVDYDPITNATLQKAYGYKLPGDSLSSGTPVSGLNYIYNSNSISSASATDNNGDEYNVTGLFSYIVINSESNCPLSTTQGSNAGYSRVTVKEIDPVTSLPNGMTEYDYTAPNQYPDNFGLLPQPIYYSYNQPPGGIGGSTPGPINPYPYVPADDRDWQRGQLLQQTEYKYANGQYTPIKYDVFAYNNPVYVDTTIGLLTRYKQEVYPMTADTVAFGPAGDVLFYQEIYAAQNYAYTSGYMLPASKSETMVADNGVPVTTVETYTYSDVPGNMLPTQISSTNSKGEITTTHMSYPFDYNVSGSPTIADAQGISLLQQQHMLSPVIERYAVRANANGSNSRIIAGSYNSFRPDRPLRDSVFKLQLSSPLTTYSPVTIGPSQLYLDPNCQPQIAFSSYDYKGNLLQQNKVFDVNHSYLWDYHVRCPIAEVVNASQSDIAYTSFEADGSGNWTIGSLVRSSGGITGSSYDSLNSDISKSGLNSATSYIVSYWTTGAAYSVPGTASGYPIKGKTETIAGASWTYYEHLVTGQSTIQINGSGGIDELRLYPSGAQMTTYTYNPLVGISSQCDVAGRITYYYYDSFGRLSYVKDQDGNVIKTYGYHYTGQATH